jgi:cysteine dioxygenase
MYNSLEDLIHDLDTYFASGNENNSIFCLKEALENYIGSDWKNFASYDQYKYKRNIIIKKDHYELILICWLPRQSSSVHNHSKNGCVVKVLSGILTETKYLIKKNNPLIKQITNYSKDSTSYIDDTIGYHKVTNNALREPLVSLHLYSPPNHIPLIYDL